MAPTDLFRYATAATPGARHDLAQVQAVARMLGTPNMPHQDHMARVATEHHPDIPNQFRYSTVVATIPRQAGKTQLYAEVQLDRSIRIPNHKTYNTQQTGKDAKAMWEESIVQAVSVSAAAAAGAPAPNPRLVGAVTKVQLGAGDPLVRFHRGGRISPFAPGPKCLDSKRKVNLIGVDEAFAFDDVNGAALMGSAVPTQAVAPWHQMWIFSTKGDRRSTWFNAWLEKGRAAVNDPSAQIAYFESSADPDCDPDDPNSLAFHPALGHLYTLDQLWSFRDQLSLTEWKRGFLNLDAEGEGSEYLLDPAVLAKLDGVTTAELPGMHELTLAVDIAIDRSAATIAAAWPDPDRQGAARVAILASRPGYDWLTDIVTALAKQYPVAFLGDPTGPTRSFLADLAALAEPPRITATDTRTYASACQWTLDAVSAGRLRHDGTQSISDQARDLVGKNLGGATAFDVHNSTGAIDTLRAVALAAHHAATRPPVQELY